jgi:hypothetical protein
MFGLFKSAPFSDPALGELVRSRGLWRGTIRLESVRTPLALAGTRAAPDPAALAVAREVPTRYAAWRSTIETALFKHYEPYAESLAAGEIQAPDESLPCIAVPAEVWPHVCLQYICVAPLGGTLTTELGYATAWDEEHTLGARFQGGTFVELCGSVLRP